MVIIAAEILGRKLPVDRHDVPLLPWDYLEAAEFFPKEKIIEPPLGIAEIFVKRSDGRIPAGEDKATVNLCLSLDQAKFGLVDFTAVGVPRPGNTGTLSVHIRP